jgi:hypothetical protein
MSVEFHTKIKETLFVDVCVDKAATVLDRLLGHTYDLGLVVTGDGSHEIRVGSHGVCDSSLFLQSDEGAGLELYVLQCDDPMYGEEGGTWLIADICTRTKLSFVLAVAFITAAALETNSTVLDEVGHLGLGRFAEPNEIIERWHLPAGSKSLRDAVSSFCKNVGFYFGEPDDR